MTIDQAIEIKERSQHWLPKKFHPDLIEADNLSIEALKRVKLCRGSRESSWANPLPGETEDCCKFCGIVHTDPECPDRGGEK